ncbi:MAG: DUF3558 family protein [Rhodoglobus sp.]
MSHSRILVTGVLTTLTLALVGCAPSVPAGGTAPTSPPAQASSPPPASSGSDASLTLIDVCTAVPASLVAGLLSRPYTEADKGFKTATASGCDYEGAGGDASGLDLMLSMQMGASKADLDTVLAKLANDGETPQPIAGLGDAAASVKDVVAALFGTTLIVATDVGEPTVGDDLTTAQLTAAVKSLQQAAR